MRRGGANNATSLPATFVAKIQQPRKKHRGDVMVAYILHVHAVQQGRKAQSIEVQLCQCGNAKSAKQQEALQKLIAPKVYDGHTNLMNALDIGHISSCCVQNSKKLSCGDCVVKIFSLDT